MNSNHLFPVLLLFAPLLERAATAQTPIPVNPRATYLRHENDASAVPSPGIPIGALGFSPGQWISISTTGAYSDGGGADNSRSLTCVFSSSVTLLPNGPGLVNRVPGAIAAGPTAGTAVTFYGALPTDIPQDFNVGRTGLANGTLVRIPPTATHLFISVNDPTYTYFSNNADPNNDFFAVFAAATPPLLHGTKEHCELRTGVNGTPTAAPDVKQASPFATVSVEIHQRFGESNGQIYVHAANAFPTAGAPPVGPLPDIHMGATFVLVQFGVTATAPGLWSFFVPPGNAGTTLILQSFFLNSNARNGFIESSDAHRIQLQ
jgi:hypothetical protein